MFANLLLIKKFGLFRHGVKSFIGIFVKSSIGIFIFQEDLIICEYCDQGVHYSCLSPPPEKRPKVWDCDDCLIQRGKPPNNNVKKRPNVGLLGPPSLDPQENSKSPELSR